MSIDVYIIRQNTPESKLLSRLGFSRGSLSIAETRGKRRSKGGFGKAPVAWRVSGQEDVERLCTGLAKILGGKPASQRTSQEQATLDRATRTLAAIRNRERKASLVPTTLPDREPIVRFFLARHYPCAAESDIVRVIAALRADPIQSVDKLRQVANEVLSSRPAAWSRARSDFVQAMIGCGRQPDECDSLRQGARVMDATGLADFEDGTTDLGQSARVVDATGAGSVTSQDWQGLLQAVCVPQLRRARS